jgi:hypothetical protein
MFLTAVGVAVDWVTLVGEPPSGWLLVGSDEPARLDATTGLARAEAPVSSRAPETSTAVVRTAAKSRAMSLRVRVDALSMNSIGVV